ncbi:MAG: hypothetical protein WCZ89_09325 [Phycisphaerae bacterium]
MPLQQIIGKVISTKTGDTLLLQDCPFIDAGVARIEETPLIGKTTANDGTPDSGIVDLGYHYMDWEYSNAGQSALAGDLDNSLRVDVNDLEILAEFWQFDYYDAYNVWWWDYDYSGRVDIGDLGYLVDYWPDYFDLIDFAMFAGYWQREVDQRLWDKRADIVRDGIVDFKDFAVLANEWQEISENPAPNLAAIFDQDPNNISGTVEVMIDRSDEIIGKVFLFIDGQLHSSMDTPVEWPMIINSNHARNGLHSFKVIGIDENDNIICGQTTAAVFNNELSSVTMNQGYKPGKPYYFYAFGSPAVNYIVDVNDNFEGDTVYSGNFEGNIQAVIPSSAFVGDNIIYDLAVKNSASPESSIFTMMINKTFDIDDYRNARMVISVGSADLERETRCASVIRAVLDAANTKIGKDYVIPLSYANSTWDNVAQCLLLPDVKIWVHFGHGNIGLTTLGRQMTMFNGSSVYSSPLPWPYHKRRAMTELGFQDNPKLNFVFFHTCYGSRTTQFAEALGILPIDATPGTRAFMSWRDAALYRDAYEKYNTYMVELWFGRDKGLVTDATLHEAKEEAARNSGGGGWRISNNLIDYGVLDTRNGDQYIHLRYPWINGSRP